MWRKPALLVLSVVVPLALLAPRPAEGALEPLQPLASVSAAPSAAVIIDNGAPDGRMAMAARLPSGSAIEIEPGDDFILSAPNQITNASFTGLLPTGQPLSSVRDVLVEIYRVFPKDSVNPPSGRVPTRNNSPSDVAFDSRQASAGTLSFTTTLLNQSFSAANSVVNGINPIPNQRTGGEGTVTGQEVRIDVTLAVYVARRPLLLRPAGAAGERHVPVAVGARPAQLHGRSPGLDSQRKPGPGLAARRYGHRGGHPPADLQRVLFATRQRHLHHSPERGRDGRAGRLRAAAGHAPRQHQHLNADQSPVSHPVHERHGRRRAGRRGDEHHGPLEHPPAGDARDL